MITMKCKGDFTKVQKYLKKVKDLPNTINFDHYAQLGVDALMKATPVDTGKTAASWYYEIKKERGRVKIEFCNSNIIKYVPIAIILQYGHATGTGGWVEGRDYINPALRPIFDEITANAWKEVEAYE